MQIGLKIDWVWVAGRTGLGVGFGGSSVCRIRRFLFLRSAGEIRKSGGPSVEPVLEQEIADD